MAALDAILEGRQGAAGRAPLPGATRAWRTAPLPGAGGAGSFPKGPRLACAVLAAALLLACCALAPDSSLAETSRAPGSTGSKLLAAPPAPEPAPGLAPAPPPDAIGDQEEADPMTDYRISVPDEELERDLLGPGGAAPETPSPSSK